MAVSGLPEPCREQALCIARLALDMMDLSMDISVDGISVVSMAILTTVVLTIEFLSFSPWQFNFPTYKAEIYSALLLVVRCLPGESTGTIGFTSPIE